MLGLRASSQQQTVQSAKVDATGYRLDELKEMLLQLRMEVQIAELNSQDECAEYSSKRGEAKALC